ncbi:MAG: bifunctional phosphoribosylaminoimidazolecarboxamide formyltransferase/IMP cyclohydrolase, partial [Candidatus Thermoplasmatota archaeon]|nr:bifunctional phosphoribosylaminoimidazolecarboxamide formyltransferase/IMP cyclohydrolase [Candidatus Thermoplasmatota archaeon]
ATTTVNGDSLLGGRVKTLHPALYAGILSERDEKSNSELVKFGFMNFDMVVVNLYPFWEHSSGTDVSSMVENIDVGGVSLLRAAAKNFAHVASIVDRSDYGPVGEEIRETGKISEETRKRLAVRAFMETARYDSMIQGTLERVLMGRDSVTVPDLSRPVSLRYGENPDQRAILYPDGSGNGIPGSIKLGGKELSYNNIVDADSALDTIMEFEEPAAVIVKHATPCGVASSTTLKDSFVRALRGDPESAYGSVIAVNREVDRETAEEMSRLFVEVISAPGYSEESLGILRKKKNLRILKTSMIPDPRMRLRSISHGILAQSPLSSGFSGLDHVGGPEAHENLISDMEFAWKVVAHCRSNAVLLAKGGATIAIGGGQTSRVEALRIALRKAGTEAGGAVMASDGYLPFDDSIRIAAESGISAVIQPGGSIRDKDSIAAANELSIPMYFTHKRVFLH